MHNPTLPQRATSLKRDGRTAVRRARVSIIGAVTATVVVAAVVAIALRPGQQTVTLRPAGAAPAGSAGAAAAGAATTGPTPATVSDLRRVADRLVAAPYETQRNTFEYTDTRVWETSVVEPSAATPDADLPVVVVRRIRSWSNAGDSGRAYLVDEAKGCPAEDQTWANEEAAPWGGPLSADPGALHRQLLGPPPNDGIDLFGQIGELFSSRIVPLATRRGVLKMLAGLPHVTVHQGALDASGRVGIAVSDTEVMPAPPPMTPYRRTLIFDPATGDLLASATTDAAVAGAPDFAALPGQRPGALGYGLHLSRRYTPNVQTPEPDCVTRATP